jgi:hypothetical protein
MKHSGFADLPLHGGRVPWLAERMEKLGTAIAENVIGHYGAGEFLSRLSNPFWFQALGCVMGKREHRSLAPLPLAFGFGAQFHKRAAYWNRRRERRPDPQPGRPPRSPGAGGAARNRRTSPEETLSTVQELTMPLHHDVRAGNVDLKRLGAVLATSYSRELRDFASLLLVENLGPRTL